MPEQDLHIALIPLDMRLGERDFNLKLARARIESLQHPVDLVLFPELMTTGFGEMKNGVAAHAESDHDVTICTMCELSKEFDVAIYGGFIGKDEDKIYNRAFFISDGKPIAFYNKRHLFAGQEQRTFTRGESLPPIITLKSWRLRPIICYDVRFPVWNRIKKNDYDAMLVIANWPNSRSYAWQHLIIARAIENQAYIAACNREGEDIYGTYQRGDSMIVNALGMPVGSVANDGNVYGKFDYKAFNTDRKNFQPWRVADDFNLNLVDK
ncbi:MAG: hypothetical protein NC338_05575 [Firmicutes bacterium]|nr:hypothetical protein [Bacillota bacterium]MCM1401410.1 hypothetical protein [Bacteroides sp.]MCM1477320.1 hypothetical protein [Bacteroides sp.]